MKKTIAAAAIGLSLLAGQAIAQNAATARVADRIGAPSGEADELAGALPAGVIFAAAAVGGFLLLKEVADDSDSD